MNAVKKAILTFFYATTLALAGCNLGSSSSSPTNSNETSKEKSNPASTQSSQTDQNKNEDTSGDRLKKLYTLTSMAPMRIYTDEKETVLVSVSGDKAQILDLGSGKIQNETSFDGEAIIDSQITDEAVLLMSDHKIKIFDLKLKQLRHTISSREKFIFASTSIYSAFGEDRTALLYQIIHENNLPRTELLVLEQSKKELSVADTDGYGFGDFLSRAEFKNGTKSLHLFKSPSPFQGQSFKSLSLLGGWYTGSANRPSEWDVELGYAIFQNDGYLYFRGLNGENVRSDIRLRLMSALQSLEFFDKNTVQLTISDFGRSEQLFKVRGSDVGKTVFSTDSFVKKNNMDPEHTFNVKILGGDLEKNKLFVSLTMCEKTPNCYHLYTANTSNEITGKFDSDIEFSAAFTPNYVAIKRSSGSTLFYSTDLNNEIFRKSFGQTNKDAEFNFSATGNYIIYSEKTSNGSSVDVWKYDEK